MDREPRTMTKREIKILTQLADLAERELNLVDLIQSQRELIVARRQLAEAQVRLAGEINDAAAYIESLLPPRLSGIVRSDYRFITSSHLGGDLFGYQWLSENELAVYLLDVMGHGVGSSLLAVTASDTIRRQTLANVDFKEPGSVLAAMNTAFPIEQNHNKFFTIWYGVYNTKSRELRYSSAGHHPALLFKPDGSRPRELGEPAHMIGLDPDELFETKVAQMPHRGRLYLFSDAAFEMTNAAGQMLGLDGLASELIEIAACDDCRVEQALQKLVQYRGKDEFDDDLSIVELEFLQ
jgi:sigma-B regulation protein RsbU (phosphoserine phosphatase)